MTSEGQVVAGRVVYRGSAIPVAWTILPANTKHAWRRYRLRRLRPLRLTTPPHWTVIGLADRGLSAGWLFRRSMRLGWPPSCASTPAARFVPVVQDALSAITTGPILEWRNGATGGRIHCLKLLKRRSYGQADFAL